jgi:hypothetical protein
MSGAALRTGDFRRIRCCPGFYRLRRTGMDCGTAG